MAATHVHAKFGGETTCAEGIPAANRVQKGALKVRFGGALKIGMCSKFDEKRLCVSARARGILLKIFNGQFENGGELCSQMYGCSAAVLLETTTSAPTALESSLCAPQTHPRALFGEWGWVQAPESVFGGGGGCFGGKKKQI